MTLPKLNKKAESYEFFDIILFIIIFVIVVTVLILTISLPAPTIYPKVQADNFVTMMLYSKKSIFDYNGAIDKPEFGILRTGSLENLDAKYFVSNVNDVIAAKLILIPSMTPEMKKTYYYNKRYYDIWAASESSEEAKAFNIYSFSYSIPVRFYENDKTKLDDATLEMTVFVSDLKPYKVYFR